MVGGVKEYALMGLMCLVVIRVLMSLVMMIELNWIVLNVCVYL